jgi:uncharacterized protein YndB with AHSA1/START domain
MTPIVESIEISRRPEDVFAYTTDPSHLPEWQESVVSVRREGDAPIAVGSWVVVTRRVGRREVTMTTELTELNPPSGWADQEGREHVEPTGDPRHPPQARLHRRLYGVKNAHPAIRELANVQPGTRSAQSARAAPGWAVLKACFPLPDKR